ncbi:hypothetical protein GCM10027059_43860 [Myceligenerans halotolerans]
MRCPHPHPHPHREPCRGGRSPRLGWVQADSSSTDPAVVMATSNTFTQWGGEVDIPDPTED